MHFKLRFVTIIHSIFGSHADLQLATYNLLTVPIKETFKISMNEYSPNIYNLLFSINGSSIFIGMFIGALISTYIANNFGRKISAILIRNAFTIIGGICMILSKFYIIFPLFIIGNIFTGMSMALKTIVLIYLSESLPKNYSGFAIFCYSSGGYLISLFGTLLALPIFIGNVNSWQYYPLISVILAIIHSSISLFFPESPKHLFITLDDKEGSRNSLKFYHGKNVNFFEIEKSFFEEKHLCSSNNPSIINCFDTLTIKRITFLLFGASMVPVFTFLNIKTVYLTSILIEHNFKPSEASNTIIIINFFALPFLLVSPLLIDKIGRKKLLKIISFFSIIEWIFFILSSIIKIDRVEKFLTVLAFFFGESAKMFGLLTLHSLLLADMSPQNLKALINKITLLISIFIVILINFIYPIATKMFGITLPVVMLIISCLLLYFLLKYLPETKETTPSQVYDMIRKKMRKVQFMHDSYGSTSSSES
ncbi:General substrate transporter family and Major facilitator superfamily domain, general substrate transporter and Major facilitator superfamily domain-containing protein [Strongyloides ratti]|uniref:General substrate transporter family and Major facilitator superfamily domain, general substrate transporter and Major facilitator superfamily domain-containing protein n=1 Tax=Strongyloides ratti TaxID=34506 RepID=A0A090LHK2_STRRB|nr:General substrate transporter family and Major facilitator superfamily domain, general substrate transporter and Major facilitator superfamily domain-containing protein [Strongyloides ratti]CEF69187.1 General substrate transporter family and Major facilitator superfamily domain, general substrate transporter and Major facilitator superfamily domain-containing protein [Strongyloides ratti]